MNILLVNGAATALWLFILTRLDTYRRDKHSTSRIMVFFLTGLLSVIPTLLLYLLFPFHLIRTDSWVLTSLLNQVLVTGPIEEFSKFAVFFILARKLKSIREPLDAVLQAAAVTLAFASVENLFYANRFGLEILVLRSVITSLGHMVLSSIWGFYYAAVVFGGSSWKSRRSRLVLLLAFFPAALCHGLSNFFLSQGMLLFYFYLELILLGLAVVIYYYLVWKSPYKTQFPGDPESNLRVIRGGLKHNPDSLILGQKAAFYCLQKGDGQQALEHIEHCLTVNPKDAYVGALRGITMMLEGRVDDGEELLQIAYRMLPSAGRWALRRTVRRLLAGRREALNRADCYPLFFVEHFFHFAER
ncbi:MAG: PrsW family intramembrane metalloprotease [Planctomycetes bacterium]|nr:PrsW family intramembrane metalloprotease [Planctomycetota bacterium]